MIRIHKLSNNGEVVVVTDIADADRFMRDLAEAIEKYVAFRADDESYSDLERDLAFIIPNAFEIVLKLKGYKTDKVNEQRMLCAGTLPAPEEKACVTI